jgi:hypothetical protein
LYLSALPMHHDARPGAPRLAVTAAGSEAHGSEGLVLVEFKISGLATNPAFACLLEIEPAQLLFLLLKRQAHFTCLLV